jgi:hypothetical protein
MAEKEERGKIQELEKEIGSLTAQGRRLSNEGRQGEAYLVGRQVEQKCRYYEALTGKPYGANNE